MLTPIKQLTEWGLSVRDGLRSELPFEGSQRQGAKWGSWEQPVTGIQGPVASVLPLSQEQRPGGVEARDAQLPSDRLDRLLWVAGASEALCTQRGIVT